MWLDARTPDTEEADALARRILTGLYETAARDRGFLASSISIRKEETALEKNETKSG